MEAQVKEFIKRELTNRPPEGSCFKVGDTVEWKNCWGYTFKNVIIGFNYENWYNKKYGKFVYIDIDAYWVPYAVSDLTLIE